MIPIQRTDIRLKADPQRVILKFLDFGKPERFLPPVQYVLGLSAEAAEKQLEGIFSEFQSRHFGLEAAFLEHYGRLAAYVPKEPSLSKKLLLGAYFTHEYSTEAAALFNPSIVPHPNQEELEEGGLRFILSMRATGEGHISSIAFRTGLVNADGTITLGPPPAKLSSGKKQSGLAFSLPFVKHRFDRGEEMNEQFRNSLPEQFTEKQALAVAHRLEEKLHLNLTSDKAQVSSIFDSNYNCSFPDSIPLESRVLFPQSAAESNGMEDARFVRFEDERGPAYLGTYTAYNGRSIRPQLIETTDFCNFRIRPFYGKGASDKGMALFPEKINGRYAMIGRQGGRELSIMFSDNLYFWEAYHPLQRPERGWEILQMGNCGSPVKTPAGWLLLTHAVGPMRKYVLSFTLLDLHQPEKVLASLEQPLLSPNAEEREGYVPNVLYTCGMIQHGEHLIIPYAMSDSAIGFATTKTESVLLELQNNKP